MTTIKRKGQTQTLKTTSQLRDQGNPLRPSDRPAKLPRSAVQPASLHPWISLQMTPLSTHHLDLNPQQQVVRRSPAKQRTQ